MDTCLSCFLTHFNNRDMNSGITLADIWGISTGNMNG